MSFMGKTKKWLWALVASPLVMFVVLSLLLYVPSIQTWMVGKVVEYVSENTPCKVSVGKVRLLFPLDLRVQDFLLTQPNDSLPQSIDTVADVRNLVADVKLLPLLRGKIVVAGVDLRDARINTVRFIESAHVRGRVGRLFLQSDGIVPGDEFADITSVILKDANVQVALNDTVPEDTSKTENHWKISLSKLRIINTSADVHMPGDTLRLRVLIGNGRAENGHFDLAPGNYSLSRLRIKGGSLKYDNNFTPTTPGLDPNHVALDSLTLGIDSFSYRGSKLAMALRECRFHEECGLSLTSLVGRLSLDSVRLNIPTLTLSTRHSSLNARVAMDMNAFDDKFPGKIDANLDGKIGKGDIIHIIGGKPMDILRLLPNRQIAVAFKFKGNMLSADMPTLKASMPTVFDLSASGHMRHLLEPDRMSGNIKLSATAHDLNFLSSMLPSGFSIPHNIRLDGTANLQGQRYATDLRLREGGGMATLKAKLDMRNMAYDGSLDVNGLNIGHYIPIKGLHAFSGNLKARGKGFDVFAPRTVMFADAGISGLKYGGHDYSGLKASLRLQNGRAYLDVDNANDIFNGNIHLNALLHQRKVDAKMSCNLVNADFYQMGVTHHPFSAAFKSHISVASDLRDYYHIDGIVSDICMRDSLHEYRPENVLAELLTRRDTTHASITSGDMGLRLNAHGGYRQLLRHSDQIIEEIKRQTADKKIDQLKLRSHFPTLCLWINTGKNNAVARFANRLGYELSSAFVDVDMSPVDGINGIMKIDSLVAHGIQLDTIRLNLKSDSVRTDFQGQIRNGRKNPQYVFNAMFGGVLYERGVYFGTRVFDANDKLGVALGLRASMEENGIKLTVGGPFDPVFGYKKFKVNKGNYLLFTNDSRVSADMKLTASDGTGVQIYSNDSTEALQDLTLGLSNFELSRVMNVLPYLPRISGVMNGDFHVIKTEEAMSVSSALTVDNMVYEGCPLGNLGSEFVYMPQENDTHVVDGTLTCNGYEVGALSGSYQPEGDGTLDATLTLTRTPLKLLNGFITDQLFGFKGYCNGSLDVKGSLSSPVVNGSMSLDSAYISSQPYGVELRFADTPVKITDSKMVFDKFKMYATNRTPLTVNGYLDFSSIDNMRLDTRISATNYLLIDSRENMRSEAYGKAYVNFIGVVRGPLESLQMRGGLDVLGTTDMTYILRDSPLTTDTQLDNLVKFTDFNGRKEIAVAKPELTGIDIDLSINIDEGAHIMCALNTDQSNYIDLVGGGSLRMQYNSIDNLRLTGRYTLSNGEMKYSLPVIPLKTFTIQDGSYVEFIGDAMNPRLNITATEETKASVSTDGGTGRSVLFNCGVKITKTLQDMGLEFIIDAPEDMAIHNELQTMTAENRGKLAVTMLTTGMYIADGNTNAFSMNSALSAFLNSQINSISGNALRTLDLSFGMDNTTTGTGEVHTDYSFKFSKRFWNNRLRIVIGGKVSSGAAVDNQDDTFFDNVTLEYRLSQNSNKYLKLFYDRDSYDWLEGYVGQYGAGFMYRRKLQKLTDLFRISRLSRKNSKTDDEDETHVTSEQGNIPTENKEKTDK